MAERPTLDQPAEFHSPLLDGPEHESEKRLFNGPEEVNGYLNLVRQLYREGKGDYRGQRTPEQVDIATYMEAEADDILQAVEELISSQPSEQHQQVQVGSLTLEDMHRSFRQLWSGMGVITNRLWRDNEQYRQSYPQLVNLEYPEQGMSDIDRLTVAGTVLNDFLELNAWRFGVTGSGVMIDSREHDYESGGMITTRVDQDKAKNQTELVRWMNELGYNEPGPEGKLGMHAAGKMSPEEARQLRRDFSKEPRRKVMQAIWYNINARSNLGKSDEST